LATQRSPLAPARFPALPPVAGVRLATRACGIKYKDRSDACLIELAAGTTIAGVFTRSLTASAPVLWCRKALRGGRGRAIIVNAGNANAFTGAAGRNSVDRIVGAVARKLKCKPREVFVVIGEELPDRQLTGALGGLRADLAAENWPAAAAAIMTTDTYPKGATRQAEIGGVTVTLNGIAKGAGMIAPDMATMLSFVVTDAKIPAKTLQALLKPAADASFNSITVDSDTSTSDTLLLCATGAVKHRRVTGPTDPRLRGFRDALGDLLRDLAQQVVRDGEVRDHRGFRRRLAPGGAAHWPGYRQLALGQDGDCRRGRQLGPYRHGRGQGRRTGRPRPARHRDRRCCRRPQRSGGAQL